MKLKKTNRILALLLACLIPSAPVVFGEHYYAAASAGGGGGQTTENFEGAGLPAGWTSASGTPDYDQATTGLGLEASQCLRIDGNDNQEEAYIAFTASDKVYAYFMFRFEDVPTASRQQFAIQNGTDAVLTMSCTTGPTTWNLTDSALQDAGSIPSVDTTYHQWVEYEKGTGANGVLRFYFSTTSTKPGAPDCEITNSAENTQANRLYFGTWGAGGGKLYVDKLILDFVNPIGSQ
jgi:hypothetical protein